MQAGWGGEGGVTVTMAQGLWECAATALAKCWRAKDALEPPGVAIAVGWEGGN